MSRGPGILQRILITALVDEPDTWFTIEELAIVAFPGQVIKPKHMSSVHRALANLPGVKLNRQREGEYGARGWRYFVSVSISPKRWG